MKKDKITRATKYKIEQEEPNKNVELTEEENTEEIEKKSHPLLTKITISSLLCLILIIAYSSIIAPKIIETKEYKVESSLLPKSFHGIKIIQFSDLHYGTTINKKQLEKIVKKINKLKPDIIFFTGNLIDKNITTTENIEKEIIDSLNNLECTLYKYAIYGDEDTSNTKYKDIITSANFKLLNNESTLLYYLDNTPIEITGYNNIESNPNYTVLTNPIDDIDTTNLYKIVLANEPNSIDKFINYNPNLVLSGHTLGGLIKIPFLPPLFLKENAKKYYKEYYKLNNTDFYISNGLGTSGINARFNNHPSISLYRLYSTQNTNY